MSPTVIATPDELLANELRKTAGDLAPAIAQALSGRTGVCDVTVSNQKGDVVAFFRGKSYRIRGTSVPPQV